jgi:hypothetical protein
VDRFEASSGHVFRGMYLSVIYRYSRYPALQTVKYSGCKKKTGNENFPNVNLILSLCQLIDKPDLT